MNQLGRLTTRVVIENHALKTGSMRHRRGGSIFGRRQQAKVTPCFENGRKALADGLAKGAGFATSEVYVLRPLDHENLLLAGTKAVLCARRSHLYSCSVRSFPGPSLLFKPSGPLHDKRLANENKTGAAGGAGRYV